MPKMMPILYEANTTTFDTEGIGRLPDCISCVVTEVRNGDFTMQMEYELDGENFSELKADRIILCYAHKYDDEPEAFAIYDILSDMLSGTATVYARQVALHRLKYTVCSRVSASGTPLTILTTALGKVVADKIGLPITLNNTVTQSIAIDTKTPVTLYDLIYGENGIIEKTGCEIKYSRYEISTLAERGKDRGGTVRYGKNLTALTQDIDATDIITAVYPYWAKESDNGTVTVVNGTVQAASVQDTSYKHVLPIDVTSDINTPDGASETWTPTQAVVNEAGAEKLKEYTGVIPVTYNASIVDDPETPDEVYDLCDTVIIQYAKIGVNLQSKIVSTAFNVLSNQWITLEIGSTQKTLEETMRMLYGNKKTITRA